MCTCLKKKCPLAVGFGLSGDNPVSFFLGNEFIIFIGRVFSGHVFRLYKRATVLVAYKAIKIFRLIKLSVWNYKKLFRISESNQYF